MVSTRNRKNDNPPRQKVYANLTACWRTRTGWMCRNTLFMTAYARERSSRGYGWRNSDRHTGLRRIATSTRSRKLIGGRPRGSVRRGRRLVPAQADAHRGEHPAAPQPWRRGESDQQRGGDQGRGTAGPRDGDEDRGEDPHARDREPDRPPARPDGCRELAVQQWRAHETQPTGDADREASQRQGGPAVE